MKTISEYNPVDTIIQGLCSSVVGSIIFGATIFLGFGFGTFFGILPEVKLADLGGVLAGSFSRIYITFPASILAVLIVPWSFLLKAGYLVSYIIFVSTEAPRTRIVMVIIAFSFALGDGILCTRQFI